MLFTVFLALGAFATMQSTMNPNPQSTMMNSAGATMNPGASTMNPSGSTMYPHSSMAPSDCSNCYCGGPALMCWASQGGNCCASSGSTQSSMNPHSSMAPSDCSNCYCGGPALMCWASQGGNCCADSGSTQSSMHPHSSMAPSGDSSQTCDCNAPAKVCSPTCCCGCNPEGFDGEKYHSCEGGCAVDNGQEPAVCVPHVKVWCNTNSNCDDPEKFCNQDAEGNFAGFCEKCYYPSDLSDEGAQGRYEERCGSDSEDGSSQGDGGQCQACMENCVHAVMATEGCDGACNACYNHPDCMFMGYSEGQECIDENCPAPDDQCPDDDHQALKDATNHHLANTTDPTLLVVKQMVNDYGCDILSHEDLGAYMCQITEVRSACTCRCGPEDCEGDDHDGFKHIMHDLPIYHEHWDMFLTYIDMAGCFALEEGAADEWCAVPSIAAACSCECGPEACPEADHAEFKRIMNTFPHNNDEGFLEFLQWVDVKGCNILEEGETAEHWCHVPGIHTACPCHCGVPYCVTDNNQAFMDYLNSFDIDDEGFKNFQQYVNTMGCTVLNHPDTAMDWCMHYETAEACPCHCAEYEDSYSSDNGDHDAYMKCFEECWDQHDDESCEHACTQCFGHDACAIFGFQHSTECINDFCGDSSEESSMAGETMVGYMYSTGAPYMYSTGAPYMYSTQDSYMASTQSANMESTQDSSYMASTQGSYMDSTQGYMASTQAPYMYSTQGYMASTQAAYMASTEAANMMSTQYAQMASTQYMASQMGSTQYPGMQSTHYPGMQSTHYPGMESTHYPGMESTHPMNSNTASTGSANSNMESTHYPGMQSTHYPGMQSTGNGNTIQSTQYMAGMYSTHTVNSNVDLAQEVAAININGEVEDISRLTFLGGFLFAAAIFVCYLQFKKHGDTIANYNAYLLDEY